MSPTATADMPEATGSTNSAQVANFLDEMQAMSARIIAEPTVLLEPMVLDVLADAERVARLRSLPTYRSLDSGVMAKSTWLA